MLSQAEIAEFDELGYLIVPGALGVTEVEIARAAFGRLAERAHALSEPTLVDGALFVVRRPEGAPVQIERIVWCGAVEPVLGELGRAHALVTRAAQLLGGPEMDQLINQAHIKSPGDGVEFHFHQDSYHRRYGTDLFTDVNGRGSFVQALTALDPMGPENGGMWVIPKSHRLGHIPTSNGRLPDGLFDPNAAEAVRLDPGDTLLLGPFTIHGSEPNRGKTERRLFINGFCCPGANKREYPGAGTGFRVKAWMSAA